MIYNLIELQPVNWVLVSIKGLPFWGGDLFIIKIAGSIMPYLFNNLSWMLRANLKFYSHETIGNNLHNHAPLSLFYHFTDFIDKIIIRKSISKLMNEFAV